MGIHEYLRRYSGDRAAATMSQRLADRLIDMYDATATDDWPWFENIATYNNAKLSQSLIAHGRWSERSASGGHRLEIAAMALRKTAFAARTISPDRFQRLQSRGRRGGGL